MNYLLNHINLIGQLGVGWLIVDWSIRIIALFIVPHNRKPTAGMAWLLFIFLFPILGIIIYIILGSPKLPKYRRNAQSNITKIIKSTVKDFQRSKNNKQLLKSNPPKKYEELVKLNETLGGLPVFSGNEVKVLPEYNDVIKKIINDIDNAKQFIHLEYFIIALDDTTLPIFDALARAVERGVTVRVMYDWLSIIRYPRHREVKKRLITDGVIVQPILKLKLPGRGYVRPDLRNHRKLIVIDGNVGYTGSQNLIKRNYHRKDDIYYDEMVVRLKGPIVLQLGAVFLSDWYSETSELLNYKNINNLNSNLKSYGSVKAQILPSGPGYDEENNLKAFTTLIHQSKNSITIVNPYFVPDDALINAITSASQRGVKVRMINSEVMDQLMVGHAQRSFYEIMMSAGVKIYLYNSPILLHSKFMIVDDEVVAVGSSNFDLRSFFLDLEVTLFCYDTKVALEFNKVVKKYLSRSTEINQNEWLKRPLLQKLLDNIARLTSAIQ